MKFSTKPTSPARQLLAECNEARADVQATQSAVLQSINRLSEAQAAPAQAEAALARFEAESAAAMSEWSRTGEGDMPTGDAERRETLERTLRNARSAAASAATAAVSLNAEREKELQKLSGIDTHSKLATATVILESVGPLLAELAERGKALKRLADSIEAGRDIALRTIESVADMGMRHEPLVALEAFDRQRQKVTGQWPTDLDAASRARQAWQSLAADLRNDAHVVVDAEAVR
jgi:DNA uptake protein ComE-like DNA-binding protein